MSCSIALATGSGRSVWFRSISPVTRWPSRYVTRPGTPTTTEFGGTSRTTTEPAPWSAYRDLQTPYGFASFDVVPHEPGGTTSITVTHYGADLGSPVYSPRDQFVMRKSLNVDRQGDQLAGAATTR